MKSLLSPATPQLEFETEPHELDLPLRRLSSSGTSALSTAELLSLVLQDDGDTVDLGGGGNLSRHLLTKMRSLRTLARCELPELLAVQGMSSRRAAALMASFELGRRTARESIIRLKVDNPQIVCQLMAHDYQGLVRESARLILLDAKFQLLRIEEVAVGSLTSSNVHFREIFKPALVHNAYAMILTHNHPTGIPTPSLDDHRMTKLLLGVADSLGIKFADHIVIGEMHSGECSYYSFKEEGLL